MGFPVGGLGRWGMSPQRILRLADTVEEAASAMMVGSLGIPVWPIFGYTCYEIIAKLNDEARARIGLDTTIWHNHGFMQLSTQDQASIRACVVSYDSWNIGNSSESERDFGVVFQHSDGTWTSYAPDGEGWLNVVFWEISYHDLTLSRPGMTPWDTATTARILMLMLAGEYDEPANAEVYCLV